VGWVLIWDPFYQDKSGEARAPPFCSLNLLEALVSASITTLAALPVGSLLAFAPFAAPALTALVRLLFISILTFLLALLAVTSITAIAIALPQCGRICGGKHPKTKH
jgi:putative Mn2+ efflux pump MntP